MTSQKGREKRTNGLKRHFNKEREHLRRYSTVTRKEQTTPHDATPHLSGKLKGTGYTSR
jgi:hypothetical protein